MEPERTDDTQFKISEPGSKLDLSVAFLQIPVKIKDKAVTYINSLIENDDEIEKGLDESKSLFDPNGCFYVISLDRVEDLLNILQKSLSYGDKDIDKTKEEIKKALTILQGQ